MTGFRLSRSLSAARAKASSSASQLRALFPSLRWASRPSSVSASRRSFLSPPLAAFFHALDAPLEHLHVGHDELQVDDLDVPRRVAAALHVDDIGVVEAPHHMYDGVGAANVLQKFISQPLALAGALDEPGDVHELDGGGGVFFRLVKLGQEVQPLVRHGHHADVRLDGAEGIVRH